MRELDPAGFAGLQHRYQAVKARIAAAVGPSRHAVRLLAASKTQSPAVVAALAGMGQRHFGENYLQEAMAKIEACADRDISWHFIGKVQANKTATLARHFDWVETVDRSRVATRLNAQRGELQTPLNVCIQVNLDHEAQKGGVDPAQTLSLAHEIGDCSRLRLRGLMAIPRASGDSGQTSEAFQRLKALYDALREQGFALDTLSMGMSGDIELAIAAGASEVRVGSALFGPRVTSQGGQQTPGAAS